MPIDSSSPRNSRSNSNALQMKVVILSVFWGPGPAPLSDFGPGPNGAKASTSLFVVWMSSCDISIMEKSQLSKIVSDVGCPLDVAKLKLCSSFWLSKDMYSEFRDFQLRENSNDFPNTVVYL